MELGTLEGDHVVTREVDRSCKTLTAEQLIMQLAKFPPDTPVVMSQTDEPYGDYGVRSVDSEEMQRDSRYADTGPWGHDSWHGCEARHPTVRWNDKLDPPQQVIFLRPDLPWQPIIDGEIGQPELTVGDVS